MSFFRDLRIAVRSLARVPALLITVALTLALDIGANAAILCGSGALAAVPLAIPMVAVLGRYASRFSVPPRSSRSISVWCGLGLGWR
jgi:hypothetical protein